MEFLHLEEVLATCHQLCFLGVLESFLCNVFGGDSTLLGMLGSSHSFSGGGSKMISSFSHLIVFVCHLTFCHLSIVVANDFSHGRALSQREAICVMIWRQLLWPRLDTFLVVDPKIVLRSEFGAVSCIAEFLSGHPFVESLEVLVSFGLGAVLMELPL